MHNQTKIDIKSSETLIKCSSNFRSNLFPRNHAVVHLFLIKYTENS